jgi:hypothetical protein
METGRLPAIKKRKDISKTVKKNTETTTVNLLALSSKENS